MANDRNGIEIKIGSTVNSGGKTNWVVEQIRPFGQFFQLIVSASSTHSPNSFLSSQVVVAR